MASRSEYKVALIAAMLAFVGAIGGTLLTGFYQGRQWKQSAKHEMQKLILQKRIEIIERTSKILNKSGVAEMLSGELDLRRKELELGKEVAAAALGSKSARTAVDKMNPDSVFGKFKEARLTLLEFHSEFAATLQLAKLFFGPSTNKAIDNMTKDPNWWQAKPDTKSALLQAMNSELTYGIESMVEVSR